MEERRHFTQTLQTVFEEMLAEDDLQTALAGALEILTYALKSEAGIIWILDRKSNRIFPFYTVGPLDLSNFSMEPGDHIESRVIHSGEPFVLPDPAADPQFPETVLEDHGIQIRNMICIPLVTLSETVGCLQIANKKTGEGFDEEEIRLCTKTAGLAALIIEEKGLDIGKDQKKEVLISLHDIVKDYPSGDSVLHVLKGIDLNVYRGEFVVLLGESGCGKSTLVNIIGGMDDLTDGRMLIDGKDFSHPAEHDLTAYRREYIGFVFQSYNLMPNLTALQNVQFIADIAKDPMGPEEAIRMVGLSERADHYPSELSGGQQQRVSIARAIVKRPQIIFADEPTAALDYQTSIEVLKVFEEIVRNTGTTVVMVTHNAEIAKMADRVVKLKGGLISSIRRNIRPAHAEELVW